MQHSCNTRTNWSYVAKTHAVEYIYTLYQGKPQFVTGIVVQPDMYTEDFEIYNSVIQVSRYADPDHQLYFSLQNRMLPGR